MAYLENTAQLQVAFLKHDLGRKHSNGNYIKIWGMKKSTLIEPTYLELHQWTKDGLSDYDFVKIEQMEFLC